MKLLPDGLQKYPPKWGPEQKLGVHGRSNQ